MEEFTLDRRTLVRSVGAAGGLSVLSAAAAATADEEPTVPNTDRHTRLTYAAVVDAVVPRTPGLEGDLGPAHVPGGLEIGLDAYLVTYVNDLFAGVAGPASERAGDLRLAEFVAAVLEEAATELVARGENDERPSARYADDLAERSSLVEGAADVASAGLFARLTRQDRLNALTLLDEKELDTAPLAAETPVPLVESDGGLIPTLVVGFTEVIYYSEWQGYDDVTVPPSDREFANDRSAVQSWRQTGFPGVADGYAAFRGYWGRPGSDTALGAGAVWKRVDTGDGPPLTVTYESGEFRDNDYDTGGYEEVFATDGTPETDRPVGGGPSGDGGAGDALSDGGAS